MAVLTESEMGRRFVLPRVGEIGLFKAVVIFKNGVSDAIASIGKKPVYQSTVVPTMGKKDDRPNLPPIAIASLKEEERPFMETIKTLYPDTYNWKK